MNNGKKMQAKLSRLRKENQRLKVEREIFDYLITIALSQF